MAGKSKEPESSRWGDSGKKRRWAKVAYAYKNLILSTVHLHLVRAQTRSSSNPNHHGLICCTPCTVLALGAAPMKTRPKSKQRAKNEDDNGSSDDLDSEEDEMEAPAGGRSGSGADKAALKRARNREAAKRVRQRRVNTIKTLNDRVRARAEPRGREGSRGVSRGSTQQSRMSAPTAAAAPAQTPTPRPHSPRPPPPAAPAGQRPHLGQRQAAAVAGGGDTGGAVALLPPRAAAGSRRHPRVDGRGDSQAGGRRGKGAAPAALHAAALACSACACGLHGGGGQSVHGVAHAAAVCCPCSSTHPLYRKRTRQETERQPGSRPSSSANGERPPSDTPNLLAAAAAGLAPAAPLDLSQQPPTALARALTAALQQQQQQLILNPGTVPPGALEQLRAMVEVQHCVQQSMPCIVTAQRAAIQMQQQEAMLVAAAGVGLGLPLGAAAAAASAAPPAAAVAAQAAAGQLPSTSGCGGAAAAAAAAAAAGTPGSSQMHQRPRPKRSASPAPAPEDLGWSDPQVIVPLHRLPGKPAAAQSQLSQQQQRQGRSSAASPAGSNSVGGAGGAGDAAAAGQRSSATAAQADEAAAALGRLNTADEMQLGMTFESLMGHMSQLDSGPAAMMSADMDLSAVGVNLIDNIIDNLGNVGTLGGAVGTSSFKLHRPKGAGGGAGGGNPHHGNLGGGNSGGGNSGVGGFPVVKTSDMNITTEEFLKGVAAPGHSGRGGGGGGAPRANGSGFEESW